MADISDTLAIVLQISLCSCLQNSREHFEVAAYSCGSDVNKSGIGAAIVCRTAARISEFSDTPATVLQISLRSYLQTSARVSNFANTLTAAMQINLALPLQLSTEQPRECQNFLTLSQLFCR